MPVSEATYERIALEDPESNWELVCGRLRRTPERTQEHNDVARLLGYFLQSQLDLSRYTVSTNLSRTRLQAGNYFVPMSLPSPRNSGGGDSDRQLLEVHHMLASRNRVALRQERFAVLLNRLAHVAQRFLDRSPVAEAARERRALCEVGLILGIAFDHDFEAVVTHRPSVAALTALSATR